MKFALEIWSSNLKQIEATVRRAEGLGFDACYYGESPTPLNLDCWSVLTFLAARFREIRLGPVLSHCLPGYRSLPRLAKEAATVALIAEGRLDFRTGAGAARHHGSVWWEPFGVAYPRYSERLAVLESWLPVLRVLWRGGACPLGGRESGPPVSLGFEAPEIPITIAAVGPAGLVCAARHADVWEASYMSAEEFEALARRMAALAADQDRKLRCSLEVDVFIAGDRLAAHALRRAVTAERGPHHAQRVLDRALQGTPDDVARQLDRLERAGADQLLLAFHDPHDARALEAFARAVVLHRGER